MTHHLCHSSKLIIAFLHYLVQFGLSPTGSTVVRALRGSHMRMSPEPPPDDSAEGLQVCEIVVPQVCTPFRASFLVSFPASFHALFHA
jgi:hypothetical protein